MDDNTNQFDPRPRRSGNIRGIYTKRRLRLTSAGPPAATSIDDIDPNVCNAIHNINACTPEELEALGVVPMPSSIAVDEPHPEIEVDDKPEPLFMDGEPRHLQTTEHECATD